MTKDKHVKRTTKLSVNVILQYESIKRRSPLKEPQCLLGKPWLKFSIPQVQNRSEKSNLNLSLQDKSRET